MLPTNINFSPDEKNRLMSALRAAWAVPWVDDIVGFIWEAVFHYVKELNIPNRLIVREPTKTKTSVIQDSSAEIAQQLDLPTLEINRTSKRLYDALDLKSDMGWSLKAVQLARLNLIAGIEVPFVIQRADIFKKYKNLGFSTELSKDSSTDDLGIVIVKHWNDKVEQDGEAQGVIDGRLAILVKNSNRQEYVYVEQPIIKFQANDFDWMWTNNDKIGLQAKRKSDGKVILRWYANQKQLFQSVTIPDSATRVSIIPKRAEVDKFVASMLESLD